MLFGSFQASVDDRPLAGFPTDKVRAQLGFLALEPDRPHRREVLASLLWPDWPEEDARRNLRQSLHRLKQTLERGQPGMADRLLQASAS
jgi:DNA-binding SARP family transcriptional activator